MPCCRARRAGRGASAVDYPFDRERLAAIREREEAAFIARTPRSRAMTERARRSMPDGVPMAWMAGLHRHPPLYVAGGGGSRFEDLDGNRYLDFNLADLSNTVGYGDTPVARRLAAQALRGAQFLLPTEDAVAVAEELGRRTALPFWQFTISASSANVEIIRIARALTGRSRILLFNGKYHGHIEATMTLGGGPGGNAPAVPEAMGLSSRAAADSINVPFNDLPAAEAALANGDVALVLLEPALTNCGLVLPEAGYLAALCALARAAGALVAFDETHTWQLAFGGFARAEGVTPDLITLGKGLGGGAPLGAYGMGPAISAFVERHLDVYAAPTRGLAIGGTTFGSALTLAAARAMLEEVASESAYARIAALGKRLADGIAAMIQARRLPWCAFRYGPRSGFCVTPDLPRNYDEAHPSMDQGLSDARRLYMANRGIWEAIASAGPQVSFAHDVTDIDNYLQVAADFLDEMGLS